MNKWIWIGIILVVAVAAFWVGHKMGVKSEQECTDCNKKGTTKVDALKAPVGGIDKDKTKETSGVKVVVA